MLKMFIYILIFFTLYIFYLVNNIVTEPYMDEIFHFPQAEKYLKGIYDEWDPKITTPPGLYLITIAVLRPLSQIANLDLSKVACFRLVNLYFTVGTMYVVFRTLQHLHKHESKDRVLLLSSFNITTFPVLYFFNFLYYTDSGSTFFVLLMWYWHLKKYHFSSAVMGAVSILFRQTNIVWVFCAASNETLCSLIDTCSEELSKKTDQRNHAIILTSFSDFQAKILPIWTKNWKKILKNMIRINFGYILVAISFLIFLIENGSLALGDKAAHTVSFHAPQLLYFSLFTCCFSSPYFMSFSKAKQFLSFVFRNKMLVFEVFMGCTVCIVFMTHVHPYLLADNRHFTFYIWRKILGRNIVLSLALIPLYIFSGWSIVGSLQHKNVIFKVIIAFCIVVSVVPQRLLEFRYFIVPFLMVRMHLRVESDLQPYLEFILFIVINFIVLYLFLFQELPWDSTEKSVRIMW